MFVAASSAAAPSTAGVLAAMARAGASGAPPSGSERGGVSIAKSRTARFLGRMIISELSSDAYAARPAAATGAAPTGVGTGSSLSE